MKVVLCFLLILPFVTMTPVRRSSIDTGNPFLNAALDLINADHLIDIVQTLLNEYGTDEREAQCEQGCVNLADTQIHTHAIHNVGVASCPLICRSFQEIVHAFHLRPQTTMAPTAAL